MPRTDVVVVGAGIVGLATAYQLSQRSPRKRMIVVEKECGPARHQSGHNSGVLHSGIYYKPGSRKAQNCLEGKVQMRAFCEAHGLRIEDCGKLIVATREEEMPRLQALFERGKANGVDCCLIGPEEIAELEPSARGLRAIRVPEAAILDYPAVCLKLLELIQEAGHEVRFNCKVTGRVGAAIKTSGEPVEAKVVVNCAGLYSDVVAGEAGKRAGVQIVPFRGEYFQLSKEASSKVRGLIYPVPNPALPFLGVHFTRMIHGGVECGPNAVLAFAREGYRKTSVSPLELLGTLRFSGFRRVARRYLGVGLYEFRRSLSKRLFLRDLQELVPSVTGADLVPAHGGVRAQAIAADGTLVDDFVIVESSGAVDVLNAPSPGATASLSIGAHIAERVLAQLD